MPTSKYRQKTRTILRELFGDKCYWCGGVMEFAKLGIAHPNMPEMATIEHHLAKESGNSKFMPSLRLAHKRCNI